MRALFLILILITLSSEGKAKADQVALIGSFSNLVATEDADPHIVEGYSIRVYSQGTLLFGSMAVATGSLEPAQGRLYDIKYDPSTKKLAFKSKLTTGMVDGPGLGPDGRPAHDLFVFNGRINGKRLQGIMVHKDGYAPTASEKSHVSLKKEDTISLPKSYEEWLGYTALFSSW